MHRSKARLEDWSIRHGITRRRLVVTKNCLWRWFKLGLGVYCVYLIVTYGPTIISNTVRSWIEEQLLNPQQLFTEVIVLLIAELPILLFVSRVTGESKAPVAKLSCNAARISKNAEGSDILGVHVTNVGEVAALDCEARLTLEIKTTDLLTSGIPLKPLKPPFKTKLQWADATEHISLRVGDIAELEIIRVSKVGDNEHFELPSDKGWNPVAFSVRPDYYFGSIKIVPMNGKPTTNRFVLRRMSIEGSSPPEKRWVLTL